MATPEILVTSHISEKSQPPGEEIEEEDDQKDAQKDAEAAAGAANSVKKEGAATNEKNDDFEDGGVPLIYLCATCWHETEGEMLSLLKSLFRFALMIRMMAWQRRQTSRQIMPEWKCE